MSSPGMSVPSPVRSSFPRQMASPSTPRLEAAEGSPLRARGRSPLRQQRHQIHTAPASPAPPPPPFVTLSASPSGRRTPTRRVGSPSSRGRFAQSYVVGFEAPTRNAPYDTREGTLITSVKGYTDHVLKPMISRIETILDKRKRLTYITPEDMTTMRCAMERNESFMKNIEGVLSNAVSCGAGIEQGVIRHAYDAWSECNSMNHQIRAVLQGEEPIELAPRRAPSSSSKRSGSPGGTTSSGRTRTPLPSSLSDTTDPKRQFIGPRSVRTTSPVSLISSRRTAEGSSHNVTDRYAIPNNGSTPQLPAPHTAATRSASSEYSHRSPGMSQAPLPVRLVAETFEGASPPTEEEEGHLVDQLHEIATSEHIDTADVQRAQQIFSRLHSGTNSKDAGNAAERAFMAWLAQLPLDVLRRLQGDLPP